jgi:predicted transposase YbfD/YdcC
LIRKTLFPPVLQTIDKAHGRLEIRSISASSILNDYLDFPYCGQVFKINRQRTHLKSDKTENETIFGITSLSPEEASPERLLQINRKHWGIENRSHYVRDVTFDEDRQQVRTKTGPQMLACLRNFAISLIRLTGGQNIASATRSLAASTAVAFSMLGL